MEFSFLAIFAKLLEILIITLLSATELEVLTWKLNKSIICGTGRARKTPANDFQTHRVALDSKYVNQTVVLHSPSPRDPFVHVLKAGDPEQASVVILR